MCVILEPDGIASNKTDNLWDAGVLLGPWRECNFHCQNILQDPWRREVHWWQRKWAARLDHTLFVGMKEEAG